jgi:Family of unknown function (DUF6266)
MSKAQNPMTGQMSGSMANFVTTTHGGQNIIRSKAFNQQDANSDSQIVVRTSFKLGAEEYISFGGLTDEGFPETPKGKTAYNLFMAANLPGAIDKSGTEPAINYSKLVIADGSLPPLVVTEGITVAEGIQISYQTKTLIPKVSETDEMVAVAKTTVGELLVTKQVRGANPVGTILIEYPGIQPAEIKCCYLFVRSADGSKASKSVYIPFYGAHPHI